VADRYLLESSTVDGYQLEDASGVLLLEGLDFTPVITPARPVVRPYARAAYVLALAFVPLVAAASLDAASGTQGGHPPIALTTLQYQAITGPVLVPAEAGETVTLDKWISQPPGRPALAWRPSGETVAPLYVPDVTQPVTARSWAPSYPDRVPAAPRPVDYQQSVAPLYVADVTAPAPTIGRAFYPDRVPGLPRAAEFPQAVAPLFVPDVTSPAPSLAWAPTYPDRVPAKPRAADFPYIPAPLVVADVTDPPPLRAWAPSLADVVRRPLVVVGVRVAPLVVADVTDPAPLRSWSAVAPDVIRARVLPPIGGTVAPVAPVADAPSTSAAPAVQGGAPPLSATTLQYQSLTGPVLVPFVAPPPAPDFWLPTLPTRPTLRDGPAIQYAPIAGPVEFVVETGWLSQAPDLVRHDTRPTGGTVAPLHVPDVTDPVPALSWAPTYPDRIPPHPRPVSVGLSVAPLYVPDVTVVAPALSWAPSTSDVVRLRRLVAEGYSVRPVLDLGVDEIVTLDKWHAPPVDVVRRVVRPHGGVVAPLHVPDVTEAVTALSWGTQTAVPVRRVLRPAGGLTAPVTTPDPAEIVTLDKWHQPTPQPVRVRPRVMGGLVAPVLPETTADRWQPVCPVPVRRLWSPEGGVVAPVYVLDVTVVAPLRSWAPILPERRDIQRAVNVGGSFGRVDPPSPYLPTYRYTAIVPGEDRSIVVRGESRAVTVAYESRLVVVPYESRVIVVPHDPRSASMED